jgi:hypothetical protein
MTNNDKHKSVNDSIRAQVNKGVSGLSNSDMDIFLRSGGKIKPDPDNKPVVKRDLNSNELLTALEMMDSEGITYTAAKERILEEAEAKAKAEHKDMNNWIRKSAGRK